MKLKDILPNHHIKIQSRTFDPWGYEFNGYELSYWFEAVWITPQDELEGGNNAT